MIKKISAILIIIIITNSFVGCSNEGTNSKIIYEWNEERIPFKEKFMTATVLNDVIYGTYMSEDGVVLSCINKKEKDISKEIYLENYSYIKRITTDYEGNIYILGNQQDSSEIVLTKLDFNNNTLSTNTIELPDIDKAKFLDIVDIRIDNENKSYIWCNLFLPKADVYENVSKAEIEQNVYTEVNRIYVKNSAWETVHYEQLPKKEGEKLLSFTLDSGSKPILLMHSPQDGLYYQYIDVADAKLSDEISLKESDVTYADMTEALVFTEDGFVFEKEGYLYKYNKETNKSSKLIHLTSYGIVPDNILYLGIEEDGIEIIENNEFSGISEYIVLKEGGTEKEVLTVATIGEGTSLEDSVVRFNRTHPGLRVEIVDYKKGDQSYEESLLNLKMDIISGKAPDLIDVSNIEYKALAHNGIFVDLTEWMDEELSLDMLVDAVVNVNQIDGRIYALSPSFQVYSIWGRKELLGNNVGNNLGELRALLQENNKNLSAVFGFSADEPVLTTLCTFGMNEFIDWSEGTCNFDCVYFEELLAFAKEYKGMGYDSLLEAIRKGDFIMSLGTINKVSDYLLQKEMYGGALTFVGYPTSSGSGTALRLQDTLLAINANSEHKEYAWTFLKDYILYGYSDQFFPVVQTQFDKVLSDALHTEVLQEGEQISKVPSNSYADEKHSIFVYEASESDLDEIKDLINSATNCFEYNTEIMNIIHKEAAYYFAGSKTAKEVAELVQNRVGIYLKEQGK